MLLFVLGIEGFEGVIRFYFGILTFKGTFASEYLVFEVLITSTTEMKPRAVPKLSNDVKNYRPQA